MTKQALFHIGLIPISTGSYNLTPRFANVEAQYFKKVPQSVHGRYDVGRREGALAGCGEKGLQDNRKQPKSAARFRRGVFRLSRNLYLYNNIFIPPRPLNRRTWAILLYKLPTTSLNMESHLPAGNNPSTEGPSTRAGNRPSARRRGAQACVICNKRKVIGYHAAGVREPS